MLPLEGGIVRGVRRDSGGVPRSAGSGGAASAAAAQESLTRTPGSHVRVSFRAAGSSDRVWLSRSTRMSSGRTSRCTPMPRRWLRMAFCTTCLDGPWIRAASSCSGAIRDDKAPFLVSGQVWGEGNLIGRPAILDMPVGRGHVVAFNFNPLHRDLNRGDQRLLWNAILNWQTILERKAAATP